MPPVAILNLKSLWNANFIQLLKANIFISLAACLLVYGLFCIGGATYSRMFVCILMSAKDESTCLFLT